MPEKTPHDEYWCEVMEKADRRIHDVFHGSSRSISDIVGDDNGIDDRKDVEKVLAYVLKHGDACEKSRAMLASFELVQAWHELHEHKAKGGTQ